MITPSELVSEVGRELGVSGWREVTQRDISSFADTTGDHSPLHTDPEWAATSRHGRTIAHGLYLLALIPSMLDEIVDIRSEEQLFYGFDRIRFTAAVPVGERIRLAAKVRAATRTAGRQHITFDFAVGIAGFAKPACVAIGSLLYFDEKGIR